MNDNTGRDQVLRVELLDGRIVISIGLDVLKHAIEFHPTEPAIVTDIDLFAPEIIAALHEEAEDGTTPVHILLDKAAGRAIENGAEGVHIPEDDL